MRKVNLHTHTNFCDGKNTPEEMVNTYGTYEIQPTNATDCDFPAITQGLPSEDIMHHPSNFSEGIVPKLNKLEKDKP